MGDHRVHLKVDFSAHGKDYKLDASYNWWAEPGELDERIEDFFVRSYEDSLVYYNREAIAYQKQLDREAVEKQERAELERLQAKYLP